MGKMRVLVLAVMLSATGALVHADDAPTEDNFWAHAKLNGCASVIKDAGKADCAAIQAAKNKACSLPVDCDVDAQEKLIAKYKDAKGRLESGSVNDADKDALKDRIESLKRTLDQKHAAAHDGVPIAQGCVSAREDVQKWFADVAIPLTEHTRDEAIAKRRELLDKLDEAKRRQAEAKDHRDENPSEYDQATEALRAAENALAAFNAKYGKDFEYYAGKLVDQYNDERSSHEKPLAEARNRRDNCKAVDEMDY